MTATLCIAAACSNTADDCHAPSTCSAASSAGASGNSSAHANAGFAAGGATGTPENHGGAAGENAGAGGVGAESSAGSSADSGAGGEGGDGGDGEPPCDPSLTPSVEGCLVSNQFAIFVAPTGKSDAAGTKTAPVNSIAKALQLAGDDKIVIACSATFDEPVWISSPAKLFGGFACPGSTAPWIHEADKRTKIAPTARGIALTIAAGSAEVSVADFEFAAKDGTDPSESSIAAFVKESTPCSRRMR